jgi:hypothetical protein
MMYNKIEFFNHYFSRATEKTKLIELLDSRFKHVGQQLELLDLGSHDGALLRRIVNNYADRFPSHVKFTAVDPSDKAIEALSESDFAKNYHVTTHVGTAESYFAQHKHHFNWIIASQSLYWSRDLHFMVKQISEASDSALIVLRGNKGIYNIQSRFKDLLGNKEEQLYTADDVEKALDAQHIPYERENISTHISIPTNDDLIFTWLIGFFLQIENIEDGFPALAQVKQFIVEQCNHGLLQHDVAFFWLGKSMKKITN